ncbi:MAG: efflux RND transporter periplasmic adaptor subunit, partial [Planctomycetaceae bacterium]
MKRFLKWFGIPLLLVAIGVAGIGPAQSYLRMRNTPKYRTVEVSRGPVESLVNSTGTVKPVRSVSVGSFASGPIEEIFVDFNAVVKKDQLLAKIDPRLMQANVDRDQATLLTQKAEVARIKALLQQSRNNEERAQKLQAVNKDYLSDVEMDQYHFTRTSQEAQLELAEAGIKQAEANLKNSLSYLDYTQIKSPVDGIVIERKVDPGQTVASQFQTPEMFIIAPDMEKHMHVFASVDEADIGLIRSAQDQNRAVKFTVDAYPEELFTGKIYQIRKNSTTTQNVVTYPVVIEAPNPDLKLLPGMTANISFQIESKESVLRVPTSALRYFPNVASVRPEDRHYLEGTVTVDAENGPKLSAGEKATLAQNRQKRIVWVQGEQFLRAIPIIVGIFVNQFAELVDGELTEGQSLV